jgi:hypothetical protein
MESLNSVIYDLDIQDLDFEAACDTSECDVKPIWKTRFKCCGTVMIFCDGHLNEILDYARLGGLHRCAVCKTSDIEGNPFLTVEKL